MMRHVSRPGIRGAWAIGTLFSALFLPWVIPALLALAAAPWMPLLPIATGLWYDLLYWTPQVPWYLSGTVLGAIVTLGAFLVRSRFSSDLFA